MTISTQASGQVGCIDGSVLQITHYQDEVHVERDGRRVRLSREAARRFAGLLAPDAETTPPDAPQPTQPNPSGGAFRRLGAPTNPTLPDVVHAGYLDGGAILTLTHRGVEHTATVTTDGQIAFDGGLYGSPSAAASAACGGNRNGWTEWSTFDGPPLDDLRWLCRADQFPGDGHGYSDSSAGEMRHVARWWVEHALAEGLDPSEATAAQAEDMLSGRGYADSTLGSYRRHLRSWSAMYGKQTLET